MQTAPESEKQYQKIYELPSMSKNDIYDKTLSWMAETFVSSKSVIELKDRENGKIVGNGVTSVSIGVGVYGDCGYTMLIDIKDNKIRITYKNLRYLEAYKSNYIQMGQLKKLKLKLEDLSNDLYKYLTTREKSEW